MPTPWRRQLYAEIKKLELSGTVLDLGGSRKSGYHELIDGNHAIIDVVNMDEKTDMNLKFDLEQIFPLESNSYDSVLAFNVLEHIFNYEQFLSESFRVLKPGGRLIVGVPFLMYVHPSPHDYWRYTAETLKNIIRAAGFGSIEIKPIGKGPVTAYVQLISGLLRIGIIRDLKEYVARGIDRILGIFKKDLASMYPLGYFVIAQK